VFWLCLGSVGLSIILVALSKEHRPARGAITETLFTKRGTHP
jgi:hypothetical protein